MLPYTTYLIDLDGVIYRGNELLPGAKEFVAWLEAQHKKYVFLTNNSFATYTQILAKLDRLGIPSDVDHLMSAGQAAVQNIARRVPGGRVYVVGEQPIIERVEEQGLKVAEFDAEEADVVLVGLDRSFDYDKLSCAIHIILDGALFITVNRDPLLPVAGGFLPGCGALAAAIEAGTGVSPEVVGKPEPMLLREALTRLKSSPEETVMVGDGLDVDILAGQAAGTHTMLLLSGRASREDVATSSIKPDHVYENLAEVLTEATKDAKVS